MRADAAVFGLVWLFTSLGCGGHGDSTSGAGAGKGGALSFGQSGAATKGSTPSESPSHTGGRTGTTASGGALVGTGFGNLGGSRATTAVGGSGNATAMAGSKAAITGSDTAETLLHGVDPNTQYGACATYMVLQMVRRAQCKKGPVDQNSLALGLDQCPDAFFSEGAHASVEEVLACAEKWRTHSCEEYNRLIYPDCYSPPGDFALGEACIGPRQCQSGACAGRAEDGPCMQCVEFAGVGAKCHEANPPIACARGLECTGSGCRVPPVFNLPAGSRCERLGQCEFGYLCLVDPTDGLERCLGPRAEGESCSEVAFCATGFYCDSVLQICRRSPEENEPCATGGACSSGLYCNTNTRCERRPSAGQPCSPMSDTDRVANCEAGLECICSDDSCSAGTCYERRMPTEACDDGIGKCGKGLRCSAGVCVESGLSGLFATACGS